MKPFLFITLILTIVVIGSESFCPLLQGGGTINVCKNSGKTKCIGVGSSNTCINLVGGPFVSGFSSGGYRCTIYSRAGCSGTTNTVDRGGWSRFPFIPQSVKCPCI